MLVNITCPCLVSDVPAINHDLLPSQRRGFRAQCGGRTKNSTVRRALRRQNFMVPSAVISVYRPIILSKIAAWFSSWAPTKILTNELGRNLLYGQIPTRCSLKLDPADRLCGTILAVPGNTCKGYVLPYMDDHVPE
jgi:hypothetical protein